MILRERVLSILWSGIDVSVEFGFAMKKIYCCLIYDLEEIQTWTFLRKHMGDPISSSTWDAKTVPSDAGWVCRANVREAFANRRVFDVQDVGKPWMPIPSCLWWRWLNQSRSIVAYFYTTRSICFIICGTPEKGYVVVHEVLIKFRVLCSGGFGALGCHVCWIYFP